DQLIESKWLVNTDNGKPKKYYCITEMGKEELEKMIDEWSVFAYDVNKFLGGN
ncbi:PadR family transcriptional regulator, partial [Enterococcus faecalis]|nr:PadR family transcriptional regulator [Enterococcus faecalis]